MKNSNLTLRDIAAALSLSVSTVSKALSDSYEISDETKERVLAFAKENNYVPNRFAKSLKSGRSNSIGVVVCSIDNAVIAEMLDGIDQYCVSKGYYCIIMQSKESFEQELQNLAFLKKLGVDGILISLATETINLDYLKELKQGGVPIVLFDRLSQEIETNMVGADNFDGGYQATSHLIEKGYDRVAHITIRSPFSITTDRFRGYQKALLDNDIEYNAEYVKFCQYDNTEELDIVVSQAINELMSLPNPPNALFTGSDLISTRSVGLIQKMGLSIPEDIALVGFTNTRMAGLLDPPLSCIYQPAYEIGEKAAKVLVDQVESKTKDFEFRTVKLPTISEFRSSSAGKN